MIQSLRDSLPSLSFQTFSVRQIQDKWGRLVSFRPRDLTIREAALLIFGLMIFTAATYKLARCFTVKKPEPVLTLISREGVRLAGKFDNQNRLQGKGTKEFPGSFQIKKEEGIFTDSVLTQGIREFYNGYIHDGTFENGQLVQGTMTFANGDVWTGHFKAGKLNGQGKQDFSHRNPSVESQGTLVKEGHFVEGVIQTGKIVFKSGEVHDGTFDKGKLVEGKITTSSGRIFKGEFDLDLNLQGQGRIDYPETSKIWFEKGEFKDDELQIGIRRYRNGQVHDGKFSKGRLTEGTITFSNGDSYVGTFDEKLNLQGKGTKIVDRVTYKGIFKNGQLIKGTRTDQDGKITSVE